MQGVFPDHNVSPITASTDRTKMVVRIWETDEPGEYFYVDLNKGEVRSLFKSFPWLDRSKLSRGQKIWYSARDGLKIPAIFTPAKIKTDRNYFVILPHGGPNTRQRIGYDGWAQFFASLQKIEPNHHNQSVVSYLVPHEVKSRSNYGQF